MEEAMRKTPLNAWHRSRGANMADFGGYDMPLWYGSAREEHLAVITRAGMFDTSHMGVITVDGPGALGLLQRCFSQNLQACVGKERAPLSVGRCVYGVYLDEQGHVLDDSIVYRAGEDAYVVIVNAGMSGVISQHMRRNQGDREADITDLGGRVGKMDIQGPEAARILCKVVRNPSEVFAHMPYFSFKGHFDEASPLAGTVRLLDGTPILLSRTGYTGEFGFEIFLPPGKLLGLWEELLQAGQALGAAPCGLAARDSLRTGAVLPLSHQDIGRWPFANNPWTFALPHDVTGTSFSKSFIGDAALLAFRGAEFTYPFLGLDIRKVTAPAVVLDSRESEIGTVLTCVTESALDRSGGKLFSISSRTRPADVKPKGLSCGFVKVSRPLTPGAQITLKDRRRKISAAIVQDIRPGRTARVPMKEML